MSDPIDIYSDSNVPKVENPGLPDWLKYLLLGIGLLIVLPVLYWLVKFVVWLVVFLLKGIASVFRGIGNAAKKRKEKKKNGTEMNISVPFSI